jgi:hypothetical protein
MKPIISEDKGRLVRDLPFCREIDFYSIAVGPFAETARGTAFGLHLHTCKKRPGYPPNEIDKLLKEVFEEPN